MKKIDWEKVSDFESPEESPGFLLWKASMCWRRQIESKLAEIGLTHPQFVILASVGWLTRGAGQVTQVELAKHCSTDITMTSQILRTLEKKGFVIRQKQDGDERCKLPCLTKKGSELVERAIPLVEAVDHGFFGRLQKEQNKCLAILQKLSLKDQAPG